MDGVDRPHVREIGVKCREVLDGGIIFSNFVGEKVVDGRPGRRH